MLPQFLIMCWLMEMMLVLSSLKVVLDKGTHYPLVFSFFVLSGLSTLILKAKQLGQLHGCKISHSAPSISHLLFVDDDFLFFQAFELESQTMKNIMGTYEAALGQAINFSKSGVFYSANVSPWLKDTISHILGVSSPLNTGRYLGTPLRAQ